MRVLYIMNNVDKGGAALAFKDLIDEIIKNHSYIKPVILLAKKNSLAQYFIEKNVEVHVVNFNNFLTTERNPKIMWKFILLTRYLISKKKFLEKVENKIDFNTIDLIHSNLNRFDCGALISKKHSIPHIWHIREHGDIDFKLQNILMQNPIEYMNSFGSYFVAISESVSKKWKTAGINNISTIYDGIKIHNIDIKKNNNKKVMLIFLGGITETKGQDQFLKLISKLPKEYLNRIHIDFYGNGDRYYIKRLTKKYYFLNEHFNFFNYRNDILKQISNYDIGVNASYAEGFGRVTVEYLEQGLFVLASNSGASPEIVSNKKLGVLFDFTNDSQENIKILKEVIDKEVFNIESEYRKNFIKLNFSIQKHTTEIIKLYKKALGNDNDKSI